MKLIISLIAVIIIATFFFLFGSVSASTTLHIHLEAPNDDFIFAFSSLKSSSSPLFPNALVVIYSSAQYDHVKMNGTESDIYNDDTDTYGMCPALPLAVYNNTPLKTTINLTKSPNSTLNLLLRLHVSEAKRELKDEQIVLKTGSSKAKFEVAAAYDNDTSQRRRISHVINLKLIKSTSLKLNRYSINEDITVVVRHTHMASYDKKKKQSSHGFDWSTWLLIFFLIFSSGLIDHSVRYFIQLRPLFHDYFNQLEHQNHENNVAAEDELQ